MHDRSPQRKNQSNETETTLKKNLSKKVFLNKVYFSQCTKMTYHIGRKN